MGVSNECVLLTGGIDEATDVVVTSCHSMTHVVPGFFGFVDRARVLGVAAVPLHLGTDWELPPSWSNAPTSSALLVAQPNNPTGNYFGNSCEWVAEASRHFQLVLIDETYRLLADEPRTPAYAMNMENVLSFVSFSKVYGLAGLRVGALVGDPTVIKELEPLCRFQSVSSPALHGVLGAIEGQEDRTALLDDYKRMRRKYFAALSEFEAVVGKVVSTDCTFVLCQPSSRSARQLVDDLAELDVIVYDCAQMGMPGWIRIGVEDQSSLRAVCKALEHLASQL